MLTNQTQAIIGGLFFTWCPYEYLCICTVCQSKIKGLLWKAKLIFVVLTNQTQAIIGGLFFTWCTYEHLCICLSVHKTTFTPSFATGLSTKSCGLPSCFARLNCMLSFKFPEWRQKNWLKSGKWEKSIHSYSKRESQGYTKAIDLQNYYKNLN